MQGKKNRITINKTITPDDMMAPVEQFERNSSRECDSLEDKKMFYIFNYPDFYIGDKVEPKDFVQTLDEIDGGYGFFEHDPLEQYYDYYLIKHEDGGAYHLYGYNFSHSYQEDKEYYIDSFYDKEDAEDKIIGLLEDDPSEKNHCLLICRSKEELLKRLANEHEKGLFECYDERDTAYMNQVYSEIVEYIKALED